MSKYGPNSVPAIDLLTRTGAQDYLETLRFEIRRILVMNHMDPEDAEEVTTLMIEAAVDHYTT